MGQKFQDSTAVYQQTWNQNTAQNTALTTYGWGYSTAVITFQVTGTVSAGVVTFEGYDGYNWYALNYVELDNGTAGTTFSLGSSVAVACEMTAFSQFRARLSTVISGTGSVQITINESAAAISSIVKTTSATISGALPAGTNTIGNVNIQDGSGGGLTSTVFSAKRALDMNLQGVQGTSFTTAGFVDVKGADGNVFVRQATASNLNAAVVGTKTNNNAVPGATNVGTLPGVANAAVQTWTEGDQVSQSMDLSGNQRITLGTLIAGEDLTNNRTVVEQRFSYDAVTATGTTTVKSGAGFIHLFTINNPVQLASATTASTIVVYDNTAASGTKIGTIALPLSANLTTALPITVRWDASFATGLTFSITLGTSGSWTPDITVTYR